MPWEIGQLPLREYRLCRNYVLAKDAETNKPSDDSTTWGDPEVASAPWDATVVTSLR